MSVSTCVPVRCLYICCIAGIVSLEIQGVVNSTSEIYMFKIAYQITHLIIKLPGVVLMAGCPPNLSEGYQLSVIVTDFLCSVFSLCFKLTPLHL